ncbi:M57 family metalloprotease [Myxococcus xanthus]|uniref:M57 family metalloprotease n=1 Tax=Myxococcus xanthus TaxID=34 RepID=UPI001129621B
MTTRATLFTLACSAWMFGCSGGLEAEGDTQETIDNLIDAGFPASDIMVAEGVVYVGRDMEVSLQASREMLQRGSSSQEQYRTTNLISSNLRWIKIRPSSSVLSYSRLNRGLDEAIANFNELSLRFKFIREPVNPCVDCPQCCPPSSMATIDFVIIPATGGGAGVGGTPSGGLPFPRFGVTASLANESQDAIEHVITHELGHVIGLRHSDYYNRSISCGGSAVNEGSASVGAILIPGTPSSATAGGSLMNSCIPSGTTGEFTSSDITALTYLYGQE